MAEVNSSSPDRVEELKPCPFCGGEAKRFTIGNDEPNNAGGDCIGCGQCGASSHVEFGREENLVSCWNTRPESESVTVIREALEKVVAIEHNDEMDAEQSWQEMVRIAREALEQIQRCCEYEYGSTGKRSNIAREALARIGRLA